MIGLTSGLIWYFIKKVGFLLKKRSFCRFTKKRRVKVKWGSNGNTSVVSWPKWPQIENIPNIRTGDDTQRKWTVFSTHKSHQKSTVTSKGCPSGHSRLPYSLVFLTKGQEDFPTYSLTPKYTTDKDRRLCDLCEEKTFSSRRFLENRQKLRFFQKEPHFCYKIPNQPTSQAYHLPKFDVIWTRNKRDITVWPSCPLKRKTVTHFWQG